MHACSTRGRIRIGIQHMHFSCMDHSRSVAPMSVTCRGEDGLSSFGAGAPGACLSRVLLRRAAMREPGLCGCRSSSRRTPRARCRRACCSERRSCFWPASVLTVTWFVHHLGPVLAPRPASPAMIFAFQSVVSRMSCPSARDLTLTKFTGTTGLPESLDISERTFFLYGPMSYCEAPIPQPSGRTLWPCEGGGWAGLTLKWEELSSPLTPWGRGGWDATPDGSVLTVCRWGRSSDVGVFRGRTTGPLIPEV